jgi:GNAT superfamily N-acetyltransferase
MTQEPASFNTRTILLKLGFRNLLTIALERLLSINHFYIAKMNLKKMNLHQAVRKPQGTLCLVQPEDFMRILNQLEDLNGKDRREFLSRMIFYNHGFHSCYCVKVDEDIACIQWLLEPVDNPLIEKYYKRQFYPLHQQQVIIDNVFTFPRYRGRGYLSMISTHLLTLALEKGYTSAITYIRKDKVSTLNEFFQLGFKLTKLVRETKIFGNAVRDL